MSIPICLLPILPITCIPPLNYNLIISSVVNRDKSSLALGVGVNRLDNTLAGKSWLMRHIGRRWRPEVRKKKASKETGHKQMRPTAPSSTTAATRRTDCNRDGPPPFAAMPC